MLTISIHDNAAGARSAALATARLCIAVIAFGFLANNPVSAQIAPRTDSGLVTIGQPDVSGSSGLRTLSSMSQGSISGSSGLLLVPPDPSSGRMQPIIISGARSAMYTSGSSITVLSQGQQSSSSSSVGFAYTSYSAVVQSAMPMSENAQSVVITRSANP